MIELERLSFVPKAWCHLSFVARSPWSDCSLPRPLVFDRYELTRRDYDYYAPAEGLGAERYAWSEHLVAAREEQRDWPAPLSFDEATAIAARRGMRLPTGREWIHVAVGRNPQRFPWGRDSQVSANTVETGLHRPVAAGTFESGRSQPYGCYDLVGNVWEWVTDIVPSQTERIEAVWGIWGVWGNWGRTSVMGGAFDTPRRPTWSTYGPEQRLAFPRPDGRARNGGAIDRGAHVCRRRAVSLGASLRLG